MIPIARYGRAARRSTVSASYLTSTNINSNLTTYTFSSMSFGAAHSSRIIVCTVGSVATASSPSISSFTIGGVSATQAKFATTDVGGDVIKTAIYYAAVPTGTSGDVVITWSDGMDSCEIGLYRMINNLSATPYHTNSGATTSGTSVSTTLNIPAQGFAVGVEASESTTSNVTWTGLTEDYDLLVDGGRKGSGASSFPHAAETGKTITAATSTTTYHGLCVASWR